MTDSEKNAEDLKDAMRYFATFRANIENWRYVEANKHLLPRERLEQTIEQMLSKIAPLIEEGQANVEVEALTTFDPIDLI